MPSLLVVPQATAGLVVERWQQIEGYIGRLVVAGIRTGYVRAK
jgi:hypothetical protein